MHYLNENHLFLFLIQIFLLLGAARLLGELFRRYKQPAITAEILVGVIFGPSLFGRYFPTLFTSLFPQEIIQQNMLETMAWFGILFFLLKTGLEIDFSSAWRQRGDALIISISDIIIPMIIAFIPCMFLSAAYMGDSGGKIIFSLFIAAIMTISALPVTARILEDLKLYKTETGYLIMSALSVNDIIGWLVFTVLLGFVTQKALHLGNVALILIVTIGFVVFCLTGGRKFTNSVISYFHRKNYPEPFSLTFISLLGIICGAITLKIGIHALFGFFIAGIMAGEAKALSEKTRHVISEMVHALFIPIFFVSIGLKIDFFANFDLFLVAFMTVIGVFGRYLGAKIGVGMTKQPKSNHGLISIAHTPGGEMQIVVGMLALEYKLVTQPVFVAIVFSAIFSSIIAGPWMKYVLSRRKEVNILDFFSSRSILAGINVESRQEVIEQLVNIAVDQNNLNNGEEILKAVIAREELGGTGIGNRLAIPHARVPNLETPIIVVGHSSIGIDWNSPDGELAKVVFLILTPAQKPEMQLSLLREIASAFKDNTEIPDMPEANKTQLWDFFRERLQHRV